MIASPPTLTVLLCARNEEAVLATALSSIVNQQLQASYQLVVVDNDSTDATAAVAARFTSHVVHCARRGKVPAMLAGLEVTTGDVVAVADADTEYPADWLSHIGGAFAREPSLAMVFGSSDMGFHQPLLRRLASYSSSVMFVPSLWFGVVCSMGFNMAVRREILLAALQRLGPKALSGWGVGTTVLRMHGKGSVKYVRSMQVPKCMRRYEAQGGFRTSRLLIGEYVRLLLGRDLRVREAEYYH